MAAIQKKIHRVAVLATLLALTACATTPPPLTFMDDARAMLERARQSDAESYAPVEMGFARDRIEQARLMVDKRKYADATRLALQSEVDSELALAKSRAAKARAAATQQSSENSRLRAELLDEHDLPASETVKPADATGEQP